MEVSIKVLKDNTNDDLNVNWLGEAVVKASSDILVHNRPKGRLMTGISAIFEDWCLPCAD